MLVRVRVPSVLRDVAGGEHVIEVPLADGATCGDLFAALASSHPAFERRIRDERGDLRTHVNVFLGDEDIRRLAGLATPLDATLDVSVMAAISGG